MALAPGNTVVQYNLAQAICEKEPPEAARRFRWVADVCLAASERSFRNAAAARQRRDLQGSASLTSLADEYAQLAAAALAGYGSALRRMGEP